MRAQRKLLIAAVALALLAPATQGHAQQANGSKPAESGAATTGSTTPANEWSSKVKPTGNQELIISPAQLETIKKVDNYFNNLNNLKGLFVQTDPDKTRSRGKFYLQRPGKFRFEYGPPTRKLMVSDGRFLRIREPHQDAGDTVELDNTPIRMLLKKDVNLVRDARILNLQETNDLIVLTLQDKNPDAPGQVQIFLAKTPELELKEWVILDAQGLETRVEVGNLVTSEPIDPSLFVWENRMFQDR